MTYRVAVYGAGGGMGIATVFNELMFSRVDSVKAIDPRWERQSALDESMRRFKELLGEKLAKKIHYFAQPSVLTWEGVEVAISCAPHAQNIELTKDALQWRVPLCDLGGCGEVVAQQAALARGSETLIAPECGLSPGSANIATMHKVKHDGCKEVYVRCGGNPYPRPDPARNPLMYKLMYSAEGTASGYTGFCPQIRHGQLVEIPAVGTIASFNDDEFESTPTSHHSRFMVEQLLALGVQEHNYETLRYVGHVARLKKEGWRYTSQPEKLADRLRNDPELQFNLQRDSDHVVLAVSGDKGEPIRYDMYKDPETGFTAMQIMTSIGISLVANHIVVRGKPKGFATPPEFVDTEWYLNEHTRRMAYFSHKHSAKVLMPA